MNIYKNKINDFGNVYWDIPVSPVLPDGTEKYILTYWADDYTFEKLAYMVYGNSSLYWLILAANSITNPFNIKNGDKIRILKQEFINEVIV